MELYGLHGYDFGTDEGAYCKHREPQGCKQDCLSCKNIVFLSRKQEDKLIAIGNNRYIMRK